MATLKAQRADLKLVPYSLKQKMLSTWWMPDISPYADKDIIICDGAVRSGKTMVGSMAFVMWAMFTFNHQNFGIAGKSLDSLKRNLWVPLQQWFADVGIVVNRLSETANGYVLRYSHNGTRKENYIYLFGGKDEGSAAFVQGLTAAGFFFDECALMPESFVNQATARCSVDGAKIWFNCNPEGPFHWFKVKWIDKLKERNACRIQFSMFDNPSLSQRTLTRYRNMYEGVFFQRFVIGEWVMAEGSIYRSFADSLAEDTSGKNPYLIENPYEYLSENKPAVILIGGDWGHNKSANTAVAVAIMPGYKQVILFDELYTKEPLDPEQLYAMHMKFIKKITDKLGYARGFYENGEEMLVRGLKNSCAKAKLNISISMCVKHEIHDRIVLENTLFAQKRLRIGTKCDKAIDAFKSALWKDDKNNTTKDIRLDDGTTNIDTLDAFEYAICTCMKQLEVAGRLFN